MNATEPRAGLSGFQRSRGAAANEVSGAFRMGEGQRRRSQRHLLREHSDKSFGLFWHRTVTDEDFSDRERRIRRLEQMQKQVITAMRRFMSLEEQISAHVAEEKREAEREKEL